MDAVDANISSSRERISWFEILQIDTETLLRQLRCTHYNSEMWTSVLKSFILTCSQDFHNSLLPFCLEGICNQQLHAKEIKTNSRNWLQKVAERKKKWNNTYSGLHWMVFCYLQYRKNIVFIALFAPSTPTGCSHKTQSLFHPPQGSNKHFLRLKVETQFIAVSWWKCQLPQVCL